MIVTSFLVSATKPKAARTLSQLVSMTATAAGFAKPVDISFVAVFVEHLRHYGRFRGADQPAVRDNQNVLVYVPENPKSGRKK